jgi:hypothetical protein
LVRILVLVGASRGRTGPFFRLPGRGGCLGGAPTKWGERRGFGLGVTVMCVLLRAYKIKRLCVCLSVCTPLRSSARWRVRSRAAPPPGMCPGGPMKASQPAVSTPQERRERPPLHADAPSSKRWWSRSAAS